MPASANRSSNMHCCVALRTYLPQVSIALHLKSKGLGARQLEPRQRLRRPRMAGKKVEGTVYVSGLANNVSLLPFIFLSLFRPRLPPQAGLERRKCLLWNSSGGTSAKIAPGASGWAWPGSVASDSVCRVCPCTERERGCSRQSHLLVC